MQTENRIDIHGSAERIFELAANIQDWPAILPHYRYVRILEQNGNVKTAEMGASRDGFPVKWRCRQELIPEERRILFRHIGGITKGMEVEWRLVPEGEVVHVTIIHELDYRLPVIGPWFARAIVGKMFVHYIAGKTLRCIKEMVEREAQQTAVL
jgi:ribosome-associated toxin RatA of RatAB toxin-antitoxin module